MNKFRLLLTSLLAIPSASLAAAAPLNSHLLSLVPPEAQMVSAFQNPCAPGTVSLLSVTHNNNLDLQDWVSLAFADPALSVHEVVQVAGDSQGGELDAHLLLLEGRFDSGRILNSAERAGAAGTHVGTHRVLVVSPFPREEGETPGLRWLAFIDSDTALFGSPALVRSALQRYDSRTAVDPRLQAALRQIEPHAEAWSVLTTPIQKITRHLGRQDSTSAWLLAFQDADRMTFSIRPGKIDFTLNLDTGVAQGGQDAGTRATLLRAKLTQDPRWQLRRLTQQEGQLSGTIAIPRAQSHAPLAERLSAKNELP